jgi:ATP-dependent RNA helicase RhlE
MKFEELGLIEPIQRAVRKEGYTTPTPIQQQAIPPVMQGQDVLGCAQTGTGKTAGFSLPILHRLAQDQPQSKRHIRTLILSPTRELAAQIHDSIKAYGRYLKLYSTVIFGGVSQKNQVRDLKRGVDIVVATPGRLMDLMNQGHVKLDHLEVFVLDEADRMLDMGFIADIRRIIAKLPAQRQTLFFSATMPREIRSLADNILRDPVEIHIAPEAPAAETVDQKLYYVERKDKQALLEHLLQREEITRALVFIRTKRGADRVTRRLKKANIQADTFHSDRTQGARQRILRDFKNGKTRVLVASDIAARGLDVDDISHVINYDMPNQAETYVHRIGRTGRAGAQGRALSFCDIEERLYLDDIHKLLPEPLEAVDSHPYVSDIPASSGKKKSTPKPPPGFSNTRRPMRRRLRAR